MEPPPPPHPRQQASSPAHARRHQKDRFTNIQHEIKQQSFKKTIISVETRQNKTYPRQQKGPSGCIVIYEQFMKAHWLWS